MVTPTEKLSLKLREDQEIINFCLVGLGRAGQFHLTSLSMAANGVARLKWVVDKNEDLCKQVAAQIGCTWSSNIEDALNDEKVHAVIIASTTNTHYPYCVQALKAKKAVFTEKPISHHPEEIAEVLGLAKASKKPFVVGYQRRVDPNFRSVKQQIENGAIGGLRIIKCCSRDNPLPPIEYLRTSGGIFHDMLSHDFDMIHFLSGQYPESVYTIAHCYEPEIAKMDGDVDTTLVTMSFASGLIATVDCCRIAAYGYDQRVEAFGEKGMLSCDNQKESTVELATSEGYKTPVAQWSFPQRYKHTYTTEILEFCAMIQQNLCEADEVVDRHMPLEKVATAAMLSLKLDRKILLSEVDDLRSCLHQGSNGHPEKKQRTV